MWEFVRYTLFYFLRLNLLACTAVVYSRLVADILGRDKSYADSLSAVIYIASVMLLYKWVFHGAVDKAGQRGDEE